MIVQYNKITPENRSVIRSIESKSYTGYIRYLLLKRWPYSRVKRELMRLGLAWNEKEDYLTYFSEVIFPLVKKHRLGKYYKKYERDMDAPSLSFSSTFKNSEKDRFAFVDILEILEVTQFFVEEIIDHYGSLAHIPTHPQTGFPLIPNEKPVDLVEILQNPKRHVIESLLVEGYSPKQIENHLQQRYDIELTQKEITIYAKSFFDVKRQDIQRMLDTLQEEKDLLEARLREVKQQPKDDFSVGERFEILNTMNNKLSELNRTISKLSNVHTSASYNAVVLEATDMREIFSDVMTRAHKRFRDMDERTEDDVVGPLNNLVSMMSKATDKILSINDIINQTSVKSVNEEMLEVIQPTLDRIAEEEREAMYAYERLNKKADDVPDEDEKILGFD